MPVAVCILLSYQILEEMARSESKNSFCQKKTNFDEALLFQKVKLSSGVIYNNECDHSIVEMINEEETSPFLKGLQSESNLAFF